MALTTTWTGQDAVAFTAGTLDTIAAVVTQVEKNINRGSIGATSTPTATEVNNWIIQGKQKIQAFYNFGLSRVFSQAATVAGTYRYALPKDFSGGGTILRDITQNKRLDFLDRVSFDTVYPDPAGSSNALPRIYTIKDRELWLHAPASTASTLELEYPRSGDDTTTTDLTYLPELIRYDLADFATYRALLRLQEYQAAQQYKVEWAESVKLSRKTDSKKKWAEMGYMARNWHYVNKPVRRRRSSVTY